MKKAKVKHILIRDKIYIQNKDIESIEDLKALYTYYNGEEFITTFEEFEDYVTVPSNSYFKLEWDSIEDERQFVKLDYELKFNGELREEQQEAVDKLFLDDRARSGLLQAKPGWGKTFAACNLIARNNTKTLILVHTKLLFRQWIKEIESQLSNIPVGKVGDGLFQLEDITVAIYKTAYNKIDSLREEFSTVIVDEAHKCPADMFSHVVNNLNAKIKIAATATPKRKDGKHVFLLDFFSTYKVIAIDSRKTPKPKVRIYQTDVKFHVVDPKKQWAKAINKLCENLNYQKYIAGLVTEFIGQNRCPLIIGERVQFLKDMSAMVPQTACLIGSTKDDEREDVLENMGTKYKGVFSTKLFDEGISCHRLDTLILTCPSNNPVQLEQRIGRIERLHDDAQWPLIADIWLRGAIVNRQQNNREQWYRSNGYNIL